MPIELNIGDMAERPENVVLPGVGKKEPSLIEQAKGIVNTINELKKLGDDMGIDVPGLLRGALAKTGQGFGQNQPPAPQPMQQGPSAVQLLMMMVKGWQASYGDITIMELLDKLREDYGHVKLSQFTGLAGMLK